MHPTAKFCSLKKWTGSAVLPRKTMIQPSTPYTDLSAPMHSVTDRRQTTNYSRPYCVTYGRLKLHVHFQIAAQSWKCIKLYAFLPYTPDRSITVNKSLWTNSSLSAIFNNCDCDLSFPDFIHTRCYRTVLRRARLCDSMSSIRPSVCLSVTFTYRDQIGWNTSKLISRSTSFTCAHWIWCNGNTPKIRVE